MSPGDRIRLYADRIGLTQEDVDYLLGVVGEAVLVEREACARLAHPKVRPPTISREAFDAGVNLAAAIRARKETWPVSTSPFPVGARVVKNPAAWRPNDFDAWGRGLGVGVVAEPPFPLEAGWVDVRWPAGRCFEEASGLLLEGADPCS